MLRDTELIELVLDTREWLEHARVHQSYEQGRATASRSLLAIERDLAERMPEAYAEHVAERESWPA